MSERRLAAIMFTDIVGYTALMGSDEDKALEILRKSRDIHSELIQQYHGTVIKEMGDGNLAQFNSASEAVQCAVEIQKDAQKEIDAQIRIGIHLGDVTWENQDVFGDGVNIASRLQSITDPGGIYISESIQKAIRAKSDIQTKYLGEFTLKNVSYAVRTYAVQGEGLPVPTNAKINKLLDLGKKKRLFKSFEIYFLIFIVLISGFLWQKNRLINVQNKISSLVFLPFENFTGSDTMEYMMAGMHDALIGEVGKVGSLRVPGTKTANTYKHAEKSIPEIAGELQVDAGVETSVSCYGDQICFQVKLVSAFPEEKQIWVKDYSVNKSQIQNWYKVLVKEISQEIRVTLTPGEEALLESSDSIDPVAYELYMKGKFLLNQISDASLKNANEYFRLASEKEPDWAAPYEGLAAVGFYQRQMGFVPDTFVLPIIEENLVKALELDPDAANTHHIKAGYAVWTEFDWEKGEREFKKSIELKPNFAQARIFYAHLLMILRRTDEALSHAKIAEELEPLDPFIQGLYADVLKRSGDCEAAKKHAEKGLSIEPNHHFALGELMGAYQCLGEFERAFDIRKHNPLWEMYRVTEFMDSIFHNKGWLALIEEEIKLNEENHIGGQDFVYQFLRYLEIGNLERALDYMEKMYEQRNPNIPYFAAIDHYKVLKDNPRYIALLEKMNLPVD